MIDMRYQSNEVCVAGVSSMHEANFSTHTHTNSAFLSHLNPVTLVGLLVLAKSFRRVVKSSSFRSDMIIALVTGESGGISWCATKAFNYIFRGMRQKSLELSVRREHSFDGPVRLCSCKDPSATP